jgi:hypothetical protein
MSEEGSLADKGMKCDYCDADAVLKFRKTKLIRRGHRRFPTPTMQWVGGCAKHLDRAMKLTRGG